MTDRARTGGRALRLVLIACAASAVGAIIVAVDRAPARPAGIATPVQPGVIPAPDALIPEEAGVFRPTAAIVAIDPGDARHRAAHPRTLRTARALRAYPGAPPRIPHGFTADEFRTGACKTCHERGGFSPRFGAYVPLTPHPEMGACLQCHLGNDAVTGVALPTADPSARCRQCHDPSAIGAPKEATSWVTTAWPSLAPRTPHRPPPPIPHDMQWRENCLACHSGPAAVAEIRTPHPERASCRQCHVHPTSAAAYVRPASPPPGGAGR